MCHFRDHDLVRKAARSMYPFSGRLIAARGGVCNGALERLSEVDDHGQRQPAVTCPDVGAVACPCLVWPNCPKFLIQEVWCNSQMMGTVRRLLVVLGPSTRMPFYDSRRQSLRWPTAPSGSFNSSLIKGRPQLPSERRRRSLICVCNNM